MTEEEKRGEDERNFKSSTSCEDNISTDSLFAFNSTIEFNLKVYSNNHESFSSFL